MPVTWDRLAERTDLYEIADYQRAASRLLHEQVLYHADNRQRRDYELVVSHEKDFSEALLLLGYQLDVNPTERYAAAIPISPQFGYIGVTEAYLALVLRKLYHQYMMAGVLDRGVAGVGLPELEAAFEDATGRKLPLTPRAELELLFATMRRWGIARLRKTDQDDPQPLLVEILPGIQSVLNQRAIAMLKSEAEGQFEPERPAGMRDADAVVSHTLGADMNRDVDKESMA
jgi:hypothetical protein